MNTMKRWRVSAVVLLAVFVASACQQQSPAGPTPGGRPGDPVPPPVPSPAPGPGGGDPAPSPPPVTHADEIFVGAGDIGHCNVKGASETARLLDAIGGTVFTLGDNAYDDGTADEFDRCYDPSWGRHVDHTWPSPGNHDYHMPGAQGYFSYFGLRAGGEYYHFKLGAWDIYSLNSQVPAQASSAQYQWLETELETDESACSLAYWHYPIASSSRHGPTVEMKPVWDLLAAHHADVVLAAHDHVYERFAPMNASLRSSPDGIRQFVVGTGGAPLYPFTDIAPNSDVRLAEWGVLKLVLSTAAYSWEFITVDGQTRDSGRGECH
jgi:hypothetical protein